MESQGIISKVDQPTLWCAGITKKSGAIQICVDLKWHYQCHERSAPLPKVENVLANLSGARFFRKLDGSSWFWQTALSQKSHLLSTFIMSLGCFCFNKIPFDISSAPKHFQQ